MRARASRRHGSGRSEEDSRRKRTEGGRETLERMNIEWQDPEEDIRRTAGRLQAEETAQKMSQVVAGGEGRRKCRLFICKVEILACISGSTILHFSVHTANSIHHCSSTQLLSRSAPFRHCCSSSSFLLGVCIIRAILAAVSNPWSACFRCLRCFFSRAWWGNAILTRHGDV